MTASVTVEGGRWDLIGLSAKVGGKGKLWRKKPALLEDWKITQEGSN